MWRKVTRLKQRGEIPPPPPPPTYSEHRTFKTFFFAITDSQKWQKKASALFVHPKLHGKKILQLLHCPPPPPPPPPPPQSRGMATLHPGGGGGTTRSRARTTADLAVILYIEFPLKTTRFFVRRKSFCCLLLGS